jgi:gluconokinase
MQESVVVMGVAGCGKSTVGAALSHALGLPLVEASACRSSRATISTARTAASR